MNPSEPTKTSETPETDANAGYIDADGYFRRDNQAKWFVTFEYCQSLETRLTEANREIARLNELVSDGVGMRESKLEDELTTLKQQNHELSQVASNNSDWFDSLVKDLAAKLQCEAKPTVIFAKIDSLKQQMAGMDQDRQRMDFLENGYHRPEFLMSLSQDARKEIDRAIQSQGTK